MKKSINSIKTHFITIVKHLPIIAIGVFLGMACVLKTREDEKHDKE